MNVLFQDDPLDTLHECVLLLHADGRVKQGNRAFYQTFGRDAADTENRHLWELGAAWKTSGLRELYRAVCAAPGNTLHDLPIYHDFGAGFGEQNFVVNACRVVGDPHTKRPERFFVAMLDVSDLSRQASENCHLLAALADGKRERGATLRDVLSAATEGKLTLCLSPDDLPVRPLTSGDPVTLSLASLRGFRHALRSVAAATGMDAVRVDDFENAVGEAAMNAVVHCGQGWGEMAVIGDTVQVRVYDHGAGIALPDLPRALLEKGFSSKGTMGQGLKIIWQTSDRMFLYSTRAGTTLVLEQDKTAPIPAWLSALDNFEL